MAENEKKEDALNDTYMPRVRELKQKAIERRDKKDEGGGPYPVFINYTQELDEAEQQELKELEQKIAELSPDYKPADTLSTPKPQPEKEPEVRPPIKGVPVGYKPGQNKIQLPFQDELAKLHETLKKQKDERNSVADLVMGDKNSQVQEPIPVYVISKGQVPGAPTARGDTSPPVENKGGKVVNVPGGIPAWNDPQAPIPNRDKSKPLNAAQPGWKKPTGETFYETASTVPPAPGGKGKPGGKVEELDWWKTLTFEPGETVSRPSENKKGKKGRKKKVREDESDYEGSDYQSLEVKIGQMASNAAKGSKSSIVSGAGEAGDTVMLGVRAAAGDLKAAMDLITKAILEKVKALDNVFSAPTDMVKGSTVGEVGGAGFKAISGLGEINPDIVTGTLMKMFGKLGEKLVTSVDELVKWNNELHNANMAFAEFSPAMAMVQAQQQIRDMTLSQQRGERRAGVAEELAQSKNKLDQKLAPWEDGWANMKGKIASSLNDLAVNIITKFEQSEVGQALLEWLGGNQAPKPGGGVTVEQEMWFQNLQAEDAMKKNRPLRFP